MNDTIQTTSEFRVTKGIPEKFLKSTQDVKNKTRQRSITPAARGPGTNKQEFSSTIDDSLRKNKFGERHGSVGVNHYNTINTYRQDSTQAQTISGFGSRKVVKNSKVLKSRTRQGKNSLYGDISYGQSVVTATNTQKLSERNKSYATLGPGPGAYNHVAMFPSGPKYVIQKKTKFDSLYGTSIRQNVSPGPC